MKRFTILGATLLSLVLTLGCGGSKEVKPDANLTPKVDEAAIRKEIEEGMKKGGGRQPDFNKK